MTEAMFYETMAARYAALSGFRPDEASDISLRLHALAEQLALFSKRLESSEQQSRAETASGEQLDALAAMRGLFRRPAAKAQGVLQFVRIQEGGILRIPADTVCAAEDGTEYRTLEAAELAAGAQTVQVPSCAVLAGTGGNAAPERITRMSGPLTGRARAVNPAAFTGGADAEDDETLRIRLLADRSSPSNGANCAFYEREALAFGGISCAAASAAEGTSAIRLLVAADGQSSVPAETRAALQSALNEKREPCATITVTDAQALPVAVSLSVEVRKGADFTETSELLSARLQTLIGRLRIGQRLTRARIGQLVMDSGLVENYTITLPAADVSAGAEQILRPGSISVARMGG